MFVFKKEDDKTLLGDEEQILEAIALIKTGQETRIICPFCGKKIVGRGKEDGILRFSCSKCKMVATSKYKGKKEMEIRISFLDITTQ